MGRKRLVRTIAIVAGCSFVVGALVLALLSLTARRPAHLGVHEGRLAACPDSPNCVCTQTDDETHRLEPLRYTGSGERAMERLKAILATQPRTRTATQTENYLHIECTSLIFRFVDDVEFLVEDSTKTIHFRSASRAGFGDFGVNRRRMEAIRRAFDASSSEARGSG